LDKQQNESEYKIQASGKFGLYFGFQQAHFLPTASKIQYDFHHQIQAKCHSGKDK